MSMNLSALIEIFGDLLAEEGDIEVRFIAPYNDYEIGQITLQQPTEGNKYLRLEWQQA
jgi:hypothetical protein